jgi:hypothetical protein
VFAFHVSFQTVFTLECFKANLAILLYVIVDTPDVVAQPLLGGKTFRTLVTFQISLLQMFIGNVSCQIGFASETSGAMLARMFDPLFWIHSRAN